MVNGKPRNAFMVVLTGGNILFCGMIVAEKFQQGVAVIPTLRMIAEKAGVSQETVSHILGGKYADRYRQSTREKVMKIADRLRYRPHRGAQNMKRGRSNLIAIVHFGAGVEAAHAANLALSSKVSEAGYDYLSIDMNWYGGSVERTVAEIIRARVEGVVISHIQEVFSGAHIEELSNAGIPVVAVNGEQRANVPLVCDNLVDTFHGLTEHLIENGHRTILQLVSSYLYLDATDTHRNSHRPAGFRRAVEAHGVWMNMTEDEFFERWPLLAVSDSSVTGITVAQDEHSYRDLTRPVYKFCSRLFKSEPLPDAIVCQNDVFAMEVTAAALEYGIKIPGELAVTGYDNDRISVFPAFSITTAEQDIDSMCSRAVDILIQKITNNPVEAAVYQYNAKIIVRNSSAPAMAGANLR